MNWFDYGILLLCCVLTMLVSRVVPLFLLKEKELPQHINEALNFIPPAAFAALVANDLMSPSVFEGDILSALAPLLASLLVMFVGWKTKSLIWSVVVGVAAYALLSSAVGALLFL